MSYYTKLGLNREALETEGFSGSQTMDRFGLLTFGLVWQLASIWTNVDLAVTTTWTNLDFSGTTSWANIDAVVTTTWVDIDLPPYHSV